MIKREIYEVYAKIVDVNGSYNTLSGYPKVFDSHQFNDDCNKAKNRAYAEYYSVLGTMASREDRQKQFAMIIHANDGLVLEKKDFGKVADYPDPTYVVTITNGLGSGNYTRGAHVQISADDPIEGKQFKEWTGTEGLIFISGNMNSINATFIMIADAVNLTATYEDIPEPEPEEEFEEPLEQEG